MTAEEHLTAVAGGDPALARVLRENLRKLAAESSNPAWRELAADVLAGRTDLRTAAASSAYRDLFSDAARRYQSWSAAQAPETLQRLAAAARSSVEHLRASLDDQGKM
ncbi:hypothetical protein [Hamadaea tsunoensis]|uniref:hypothetical protein n=1 Tax=Hamadaea tsunoensis TaxID=53368 RepID=UPI0004034237|nr:hypothetical protein [Hamadaea tsunoensis]